MERLDEIRVTLVEVEKMRSQQQQLRELVHDLQNGRPGRGLLVLYTPADNNAELQRLMGRDTNAQETAVLDELVSGGVALPIGEVPTELANAMLVLAMYFYDIATHGHDQAWNRLRQLTNAPADG